MKTCEFCGRTFTVNTSDGRTRARRTCSASCRQRLYLRRREEKALSKIAAMLRDGASRQELLAAIESPH